MYLTSNPANKLIENITYRQTDGQTNIYKYTCKQINTDFKYSMEIKRKENTN